MKKILVTILISLALLGGGIIYGMKPQPSPSLRGPNPEVPELRLAPKSKAPVAEPTPEMSQPIPDEEAKVDTGSDKAKTEPPLSPDDSIQLSQDPKYEAECTEVSPGVIDCHN